MSLLTPPGKLKLIRSFKRSHKRGHRRSKSAPITFKFTRSIGSPEIKFNTKEILVSSNVNYRTKTTQQFELLSILIVKLRQNLNYRMEVFSKFQQRLSRYKNMLSNVKITKKKAKTLSGYLEEIYKKIDKLFSEKAFKHKDFFNVTSIIENKINSLFMYSP